jgi:hypothetical protein
MTDVFALGLLGLGAVLATSVWLTHRDANGLHSGFDDLIAEIRATMTGAFAAMQGAVQTGNLTRLDKRASQSLSVLPRFSWIS